MRLPREAEHWLDEEVAAVLSQLPFVEHPRYALLRLAGLYGVTKIGQLYPGGHTAGLLVRQENDKFLVLLRSKGTSTPYGLESLAHEVGHIILDDRLKAAARKVELENHTGHLIEERLVESFALRLTKRLWQLWIEQKWQ